MSKTASGAHATTDSLSKRAHEPVDRFAKAASKGEASPPYEAANVETRVRDAGQQAKQRSSSTLRSCSVFVRNNPVISLGLAIAAGVLLSAWRRR